MSDVDRVQELNRKLAEKINAEARRDPQSPYANKFVGIINGRVVIVADTMNEVGGYLRQSGADPRTCFWVEASRDYTEVYEV